MNKVVILFVWAGLLYPGYQLAAQDKTRAVKETAITWYGIDFSLAKFSHVTEDAATIVKALPGINQLVESEPEKYDLKKWFRKTDVEILLDQVNARNGVIDPAGLIVAEDNTIAIDEIKAVVSGYDTRGKKGLGLLFVGESMNKMKQTGSFYVVFFDQDTKEIVDASRYEGKAGGFGVRNYWAAAVFQVMKQWLK